MHVVSVRETRGSMNKDRVLRKNEQETDALAVSVVLYSVA